MRGVSVTDPAEFRDRAGPLLMGDELRHTIQLAVLAQIERGGRFAEHHLWVVEDGDRAVACAMMTPPFHLLVAGDPGEAFGELVATVRGGGVVVPGVTGFLPEAREFATRWAGATGAATRPVMSMRMYATSAVTPVPVADGAMRTAGEGDRALLAEWAHAFAHEAGLHEGPAVWTWEKTSFIGFLFLAAAALIAGTLFRPLRPQDYQRKTF